MRRHAAGIIKVGSIPGRCISTHKSTEIGEYLLAQKRGCEELPLVQGPGGDRERQAATAQERPRGATPRPRSGAAARRTTTPRRSGAAARRAAPPPRSGGCACAGGLRGAAPRSRSGGAAVRGYPSSR